MQVSGPPAPESLRKDQLARRQRIVRAALAALLRSNYDEVKVSAIAADAGVALGTLYRYFSSKEHLFAAVFLEWQASLNTKLAKAAPNRGSEAENVRELYQQMVSAFETQPQFLRVLIVLETTSDAYAAQMLNTSSELFRESMGSVFSEWDDEHVRISRLMSAVLFSGLRTWVMNRNTIADVREAVDSAIDLIYSDRTPAPSSKRAKAKR